MLKLYKDTELLLYLQGGDCPRYAGDIHVGYPLDQLPEDEVVIVFSQDYGLLDEVDVVHHIVDNLSFCPLFIIFKGPFHHSISLWMKGTHQGLFSVPHSDNFYSIYRLCYNYCGASLQPV